MKTRKALSNDEVLNVLTEAAPQMIQRLRKNIDDMSDAAVRNGFPDPRSNPGERNRTNSQYWELIVFDALREVFDDVFHDGKSGKMDITVLKANDEPLFVECKLISKIQDTGKTSAENRLVCHLFCVVSPDLRTGEVSWLVLKENDYQPTQHAKAYILAHAKARRTVIYTWNDDER